MYLEYLWIEEMMMMMMTTTTTTEGCYEFISAVKGICVLFFTSEHTIVCCFVCERGQVGTVS
jgi:hypothetical protein